MSSTDVDSVVTATSGSGTMDDPYSGVVRIPFSTQGTVWVVDGSQVIIHCDTKYGFRFHTINVSPGSDLDITGYLGRGGDRIGYHLAVMVHGYSNHHGTAEDPFKDGDSVVFTQDSTYYIEKGATIHVIQSLFTGANAHMYGDQCLESTTTSSWIYVDEFDLTAKEIGNATVVYEDTGDNEHPVHFQVVEPRYADLAFTSNPITDGVISYE